MERISASEMVECLLGIAAAGTLIGLIWGFAEICRALQKKMNRIKPWLQNMVARAIAYSVFQTIRRPLAGGWYERAALWLRRRRLALRT